MSGSGTNLRRARGLGLLAGLLLAGLLCTTCEFDVGTLDVRLVYEAGASDPFRSGSIIHDLRITVEGEGIHTRQTTFEVVDGKRSGRLQGLPVGERVRVTVEGMDSIGTIGYRGVSGELTVHKGSNQLFLFFSRTGHFSAPPTVQAAIAPTWRERFRTALRPGLGRAFHTANVLTDGTVLVAGGTQTPDPTDHLALLGADRTLYSAEIFDPTAGAFIKDAHFCVDGDHDGWGWSPDCLGLDCNDADPELAETCGDGCVDVDQDGYGLGDDCLGPDCDDGVGGEDCAIGACCGECPSGADLCMVKPRAFHSILALPDGDSWLVLGGEPGGLGRPPAESFSLSTRSFQQVASETMGIRSRQATARISLERAAIAGGLDGALDELDDIRAAGAAGDFENVGSMSPARAGALGIAYSNGALVIGGWEQFSPKADRTPSDAIERVWEDGDDVLVERPVNLRLHLARAEAAAVYYKHKDFGTDRILVCGGFVEDRDTGSLEPTDTCERINPGDGTVEFLGSLLAQPRWGHTMTLLPGNRVLVAGGFNRTFAGAGLKVAEILSRLDPNQQLGEVINVESGIPMVAARGGHTATLMPNGMVLLVGGISAPGVMSSPGYEIYNP